MIEYVSIAVAVLEAVWIGLLVRDGRAAADTMRGYQRDYERIRDEQEVERKTYDFNLRGWQDRADKAERQLSESAAFNLELADRNVLLRRKVDKLKKGKAK